MERLERYAELAVRVGANVAPGQIVSVGGLLAHAPLARALTRAAYAAGARCEDPEGALRAVALAHAARLDQDGRPVSSRRDG